jgi:catechol 2,3-dioxygenase-like lactoylglutathione lyase family enzyme
MGGAPTWEHSSLSVRDLDTAVAFYCQAFGFDVAFEERGMDALIESVVGAPGLRCDLAQLRQPGTNHVLELIAFRQGEQEAGSPTHPGEGHVAFVVDDLDGTLERLRALGAEQLGLVTKFPEGRSVYLREPSGSIVELSEGAATAGPPA